MGIFSKKSTTTNVTDVSNVSLGFEGIEGPAIGGEGNVLIQTDQGAIESAERIARDALGAGSDVFGSAERLARDSIGTGAQLADRSIGATLDATRSGLEFASRTQGESLALAGATFSEALRFGEAARAGERAILDRSLDLTQSSSERSSDFARGIFESSLTAVRGVVAESQSQLGSTVTALNTIAREQSTSTDERVQAIAGQALKIGALLIGLVVAAYAFRGARA